jgi:hypothetical protein
MNLSQTLQASYHSPLELEESKVDDKSYFDDCNKPRVKINSAPHSNLTEAYPFHQGIELRSMRGYVAGYAKILSGEPGHRLSRTSFGQDVVYNDVLPQVYNTSFTDGEVFDPIKHVKNELSYPFSIKNSGDQMLGPYGSILATMEPLTIRDVAGLRSTYFPYEAHGVWGLVGNGNESHTRSSDFVVSTSQIKFGGNIPFLDRNETDSYGKPGNGIFFWEKNRILPFVDTDNNQIVKNLLSGPITNVTNELNYRDNGYVPDGYVSHTTGFVYDGTKLGTDSLAFGGMTYT